MNVCVQVVCVCGGGTFLFHFFLVLHWGLTFLAQACFILLETAKQLSKMAMYEF